MKGEFELIDSIRSMFPAPDGIKGIGDDCAIIPQTSGYETLVSTDMLVEGSHFLLDDITPYRLGWKSAAVNFSDIAAMGGEPVGSFLALALPKGLPEGWMEKFLEGYRAVSLEYGFPLLGGDTTASPDRLCICVTVLGKAPEGCSKKRSGAQPGDLICVTGTLGDSGAGLQAVLKGIGREAAALIEKHYLPRPRIAEGRMLAACQGVHAMMDISDGVGSDIRHILEESGVGAVIDVRTLPVSAETKNFCSAQGLDPVEIALCGGEDYELLFTITEEAEETLGVQHTVIGRITCGDNVEWAGADRDYMGFRHF
ncbi:MAG: thiamine-phosphate kinase [Bacteroidia bacterium]|nr:thiamine-phosphate kinase [Bacteroidia bacterium]